MQPFSLLTALAGWAGYKGQVRKPTRLLVIEVVPVTLDYNFVIVQG